MLTSLVVLGIFLLLVIIYIVWPYRSKKGTMKEKQQWSPFKIDVMQTKNQVDPKQKQNNDLRDPSNSKNSGLNSQDDQSLRTQDQDEEEEDKKRPDTSDLNESGFEEDQLQDSKPTNS